MAKTEMIRARVEPELKYRFLSRMYARRVSPLRVYTV